MSSIENAELVVCDSSGSECQFRLEIPLRWTNYHVVHAAVLAKLRFEYGKTISVVSAVVQGNENVFPLSSSRFEEIGQFLSLHQRTKVQVSSAYCMLLNQADLTAGSTYSAVDTYKHDAQLR
jgi:hypothetical protein